MTAPCCDSLVELLGAEDIDELSASWEDVLQRSYDNRVFLSPLWLRTWLPHAGIVTPHIVIERDEFCELRGVLPLQTVTRDGEIVLSLLGDPNVADYMDGVADKRVADEVLLSLWNAALVHIDWDRIELLHVPSASPLITALQRACETRGLEAAVEADEVCPVTILCNTWDGYLQMLTKKQRHEIRRKIRRCEEGGDIVWRTTRERENLDADLADFFRLHESSARNKAGFMTEGMRTFFRDMAHVFIDAGTLRLSILERNGRAVASTMAFLHRGRYLLYNSGYDPRESESSPGIVAVARAMQDAIAEKAVVFDFLSGEEPYKYQFGAQNTYTCRITVTR